jgi:integrase
MEMTMKTVERENWTPRASELFKEWMRSTLNEDGSRRWNDLTVNRAIAHLKTFSKWIHSLRPFTLGNPMAKIKSIPTSSILLIERALTPVERLRLLDTVDQLRYTGGRSKSRRRYVNKERPMHRGHRPYRNRAIIYTLTGTGMRRRAVTAINLADVDFEQKTIEVEEKGGSRHAYQINKESLRAILDYIEIERNTDDEKFQSPALFLPPCTKVNCHDRLMAKAINRIWNDACKAANITGRTPHSARHAMGRFIMEKTKKVGDVQRQLGHKNSLYSIQYSRITKDELDDVLAGLDTHQEP